jgi:hypothetical protein
MSKKINCSICQKPADNMVLAIEYKGELHIFCCPYCRERFVDENGLDDIQSTAKTE